MQRFSLNGFLEVEWEEGHKKFVYSISDLQCLLKREISLLLDGDIVDLIGRKVYILFGALLTNKTWKKQEVH